MPKVRDALKLLVDHGWAVKRVRASHRQFGHLSRPGTVTVAGKRSADLAPGTWQAILRQAGLDEEVAVKYTVVHERTDRNYSAYVPDLPGCVAAAKTKAETRRLIREAIEMHIEAMREAGEPIPEPGNATELVEV